MGGLGIHNGEWSPVARLWAIIGRLNKNAFPNVEERGHFVADDQKINDFLQKKN